MNRDRIATLREQMLVRLAGRTAKSRSLLEEARTVLPGGVPSSFQDQPPHPIYVSHGKGSQVWDVDGNQYTDFHNGFGVMVMGHAHPTIAAAIAALPAAGPISLPLVSRRSGWHANCRAGSGSRRFGLPTQVPRQLSMRFASAAPSAAETAWSRSRAPTTATTTR